MATSSKYQFDDLTVEKCFSNFFVVPDYQREYVWEAEKQVEQLLTDIEEAYSNDAQKEYFIGTTVVFNNNGSNELIDGQQRTTTMTLIEKPINRSIQNKSYAEKVKEYYKSKYYLTRSLKEVDAIGNNTAVNRIGKFLKEFDHWDKTTIEERQDMLYKLSLEIWKIE